MAYETLKDAIKQIIKQNGNQEITGEVMQATLLSIVNTLGASGYISMGVANPTTDPGTPEGNAYYFATQEGSYTNFKTSTHTNIHISEPGLYIIQFNGYYWNSESLVEFSQELGYDENKVISQHAATVASQCYSIKSLMVNNAYVGVLGNEIADDPTSHRYDCTQFIALDGKDLYLSLPDSTASYRLYDKNKKHLGREYNNDMENGIIRYVEGAAFVRVNQRHENTTSDSEYNNSYAIRTDWIYDKISELLSQKKEAAYNILEGKKWCCCGDSFSVAGYNGTEGISEDVYIYQDGPFKGKQKVYGTMIAERNNMTFVNLSVGGMTMTNTGSNSFSNNIYKNIPTDSDYITLKLGINDGNKSVKIGTIDDDTDDTFYGAWNIVLKWIRDNCPYAKVGIIVGNGMGNPSYNDDYSFETNAANAIRNIALKWGYPILDEIDDITVPLLHRAHRNGVSEYAYKLLISTFAINSINTHPNVKAHEFESTIVESFLRKL